MSQTCVFPSPIEAVKLDSIFHGARLLGVSKEKSSLFNVKFRL